MSNLFLRQLLKLSITMRWINRKFLFNSIAAFLGFLIFLYCYFFVYQKIRLLSAEIGNAVKSASALDKKKEGFEAAKKVLENQAANAATLESAFFSESDFVGLLKEFERIGKKGGVIFKAKGARLPDSSPAAELSFEISGSFGSIMKFMIMLDSVRYAGAVKKMSLYPEGEKSKNLTALVDYLIFNYKK